MTSDGTTVATILPVGVSPMSLATAPATAPASSAAITKIAMAAMTLGRYASTWFMNVVTAGIFSAPTAANRKKTKTSQNTTVPTPLLTLAPRSEEHTSEL